LDYSTFATVQDQSTKSGLLPKIISTILHPVFVPTMVFAFLIFWSPTLFFGLDHKTTSWWLLIIAYITISFPLLVVFLLWRLKFIESIHMHGERERYGPLIASMLFYFWVFWLFHKTMQAPELVQSFLLGVFLTTVGIFMATIFYKISMHAAAWGGVVGFALICTFQGVQNSILFLIVSIIIAGLVGSIRLYIKAHTGPQVYSGYIVGFVMQLLSLFVVSKFLF
jgi:membrane-associated phospholipid phosphatase